MKTRLVQITFALCLIALFLLALTPAGTVLAKNPNPGILPPQSHPFGHTYGYWGGEWYKWALEQPVPINPVLDTTGEHCAVGQSGKVWFLAGTFGGDAVRECRIPKGKALFFPISNTGWVATLPTETAEMARQYSKEYADSMDISDFEVEIDGVPVEHFEKYRLYQGNLDALPIYYITLPDDNVFGPPPDGLAAGTYGPASTDGYYLMLAPLSAGKHTIHIHVEGFLDVRYTLTVK